MSCFYIKITALSSVVPKKATFGAFFVSVHRYQAITAYRITAYGFGAYIVTYALLGRRNIEIGSAWNMFPSLCVSVTQTEAGY